MKSELARRVAFSVIAAPIALWIVLTGGAPLAGLLAIASALAAWEFFRIATAGGGTPLSSFGIAAAGITPLVVHARYLQLYEPGRSIGVVTLVAILCLVVLAVVIWARGVAGKPLASAALTVFGVAYTGGMLSFAYAIRYHEYAMTGLTDGGGRLLILPLVTTWASDIGAYVVGRTMGKHKLIPSVSPGKTIEGSVGGLVGSALVAWAYVHLLLQPVTQLGFVGRTAGVLVFGIIISVAAQIGDLAESLLKREAGVKDSSTLIPGHGGVLDRVDSLLFVLPVAYALFGLMLRWTPS